MRRFLLGVLALVLLLAAAAGVLVWRISQAPLSLAWLQPTLLAMVQRGVPFQVEFTDPSLVWDAEEGVIALQVRDLTARTDQGQLVASAPVLRASVALGPLLRERQIEVVSVEIELPRMQLLRSAEGTLALRFADELAAVPLGEAAGDDGLSAVLGGASGSNDPRFSRLRLVEVKAPALAYRDEGSGAQASATDAVFTLTRDGAEWDGALAAAVGGGRVALHGAPDPGSSKIDARVLIDAVQLQSLAALLPDAPLGGLALPVSGTVQFTVDPETGSRSAIEVAISGGAGTIAVPELGLAPLSIEAVDLQGQVARSFEQAEIRRFHVAGAGFTLDASGTAELQDGQPTVDLKLQAGDLDVGEILSFWPGELATSARDWIAANLPAGQLSGASLQVKNWGPHPDQQDLAGSFGFSAVELRYLDGFPSATGLSGTANFAGDSLALQTTGGRTGAVDLGKGDITLSNLMGEGVSQLQVKLDVSSALPAALKLLDAKPIELSRKTGIPADRVAGRQATSLSLNLPLIDPLPDSRIGYRADSRLSDLEVRDVQPGYSVAASRLQLRAEPSGVSVNGEVRVNGVPLAIDLRDNTAPVQGVRRRIAANGRLDAAAVKALGFDWPAQLGGTVDVDATLVEAKSPMRKVDLKLGLDQASIDLPAIRMRKSVGEPGTARLALVQPDPASLSIENGRIDVPGWTVEGGGGLRLDPVRPERIALRQLRSPMGDLTADLTLRDGAWRGRVEVGSLDVRPFLAAAGPGGEAGAGSPAGADPVPDMALQVAAKSLQVGETPFNSLSGSVERRGGLWQRLDLRGKIADSTVSLELATTDRLSQLEVRGSDAGWVLRSLTSSDNGIRGGTLRLSASLRQAPTSLSGNGEFKVRDFTLWGAPTIARIVSLASFSGLVNALSGKGVPVRRLVAPFRLQRDVITLERAHLVGSDIGARADGTIDLDRGQLDITGTVAPAYTVNRFLGSIPLIGQLMSGRGSDALIAATFRVRGPLTAPEVSVNPLAALVPGVIRDLFGAMRSSEDEG
jgi:hypothetical protein